MPSIAIVEDQELLLQLMQDLCSQVDGVTVPIAVTTGKQLLKEIKSTPVDLVLLDLNLPDWDGPNLAHELRAHYPAMRILAVSGDSTEVTLSRTIAAGVQGFVDKNAPPEELLKAIQEISAGRTYFTAFIKSERQQRHSSTRHLTAILSEKELQLLPSLGQGLTNDEIAEVHGGSSATIQTHRRNIMNKLDVHSAPELIRFAVMRGFVRVRDDGTFRAISPEPLD